MTNPKGLSVPPWPTCPAYRSDHIPDLRTVPFSIIVFNAPTEDTLEMMTQVVAVFGDPDFGVQLRSRYLCIPVGSPLSIKAYQIAEQGQLNLQGGFYTTTAEDSPQVARMREILLDHIFNCYGRVGKLCCALNEQVVRETLESV